MYMDLCVCVCCGQHIHEVMKGPVQLKGLHMMEG